MRLLIYSVLVLLITNVVWHVYDFCQVGPVLTFYHDCGDGGTITQYRWVGGTDLVKTPRQIIDDFDHWRELHHDGEICKLYRTVLIRPLAFYRWSEYLINPAYRLPYHPLPDQ